jgi:hypothetical protein
MEISVGDKVRHTKSPLLNKGLAMDVTDTNDTQVRVEFFEGPEAVHKVHWLDKTDVVLVSQPEGGFRNAGEGS